MTINLLELLGIKTATKREFKGKSLLDIIDDYTVVDIETTGYLPSFDKIIEIGAIKYRNNIEVAKFHSLVSINTPLDSFIIEHTGITDEMLGNAPSIQDILSQFLEFIGEDIIVAHNANFDINFIYDDALNVLDVKFANSFIDTLRLSHKCNLDIENHKLTTLAKYFNIPQDIAHRSMPDCETTHILYNKLKEYIKENNIQLKAVPYDSRIAKISATVDDLDPDNPFYGKVIVFTGTLESMQRKTAAQLVANLGGILGDSVSKKTNYLVLGNYDYCSTIKEGKSKKHKYAEQLILKGQDLQISPESVFLTMIEDC